ncbi:hypothetical protein BVRB_4g075470 [Beta vulgaris subsp. vulgaris]|nr:hypothetical protein BVRB_4g075470 [Beta vulgaris subsp. vulgaris]
MFTTTNTTKPGCQRKCGNLTIPYPFGIGNGCYFRDVFAIRCNTSYNPPKAFALTGFDPDEIYPEILEMTENQVIIRNTAVTSRCYDSRGIETSYIEGSLGMQGSPYSVSNTNKLTVIGCDEYALISGSTEITNDEKAGCIALCNLEVDQVVTQGSCLGSGCCQTSVLTGWQGFHITLTSLDGRRSFTNQSCSYAFFARNGSFVFGGASDLTSNTSVVLNRIMQQVPVVLDWSASADLSCDYAKNSSTSYEPYACQSNSQCIDNTNMLGYRCRCLPGYEGNPYLEPGCTDFNECAAGPNNPCISTAVCANNPGSYICSCPSGYSGDGKKSGSGCVKNIDTSSSSLKKITLGLGISLGAMLLLLVGWWMSSVIRKRRIKKQKATNFKRNGGFLLQQHMATDESAVARIKIYTFDELERATDHFNEDRVLGKGGQGIVYKGMLGEGRIVAIKLCKVIDEESQRIDLINELVIVSQINHRNIVKLLGCCLESESPLLIYEYIPNGTLSDHLHCPRDDFQITWKMRLQIASDSAGALAYLHSSSSIPIFHRDIKSCNILLDDRYRAKISDFGTSKSISIDQTHVSTRVMGTFGYLDPEYFLLGQFTDKSDVYSFGVVLVELLTGQKAIRSALKEDRSLTQWFLSQMENCRIENSRLLDIVDSQVLHEGSKEEFLIIANIAKRCLNPDGKGRPIMKEVLLEIEAVMSLHLPKAKEEVWPKSEQMVIVSTDSDGFTSSTTSTFYLENSSLSSAEASLLFNAT